MKLSAKSPRSPAERLRLYRQGRRLRRHGVRAKIRIDEAKIEGLVKLGYLQPSERNDLNAIEQAAALFIWDSLEREDDPKASRLKEGQAEFAAHGAAPAPSK